MDRSLTLVVELLLAGLWIANLSPASHSAIRDGDQPRMGCASPFGGWKNLAIWVSRQNAVGLWGPDIAHAKSGPMGDAWDIHPRRCLCTGLGNHTDKESGVPGAVFCATCKSAPYANPPLEKGSHEGVLSPTGETDEILILS